MARETLINRTIKTLSKLPPDKVKEVSDFADFILKKYDEEILLKGMEKLVTDSKSFYFLKDEEDLYSVEDLKEKYQ
ncbi:MAG: hypothetical protein AB9834_13790 [Lentimicrobium sp.]